MRLPSQFNNNVINTWGAEGANWLMKLPSFVADTAKLWQLQNIITFEKLNFNFLIKAYSAKYQQEVVVKFCFDEAEFSHEIDALIHYDGQVAVKLIEENRTLKAILLEALHPGDNLKKYFPEDDLDSTLIACEVIKKLHENKTLKNFHHFPKIEDCLQGLNIEHPLIDQAMLNKAILMAERLIQTQSNRYLLHGDLHHKNIIFDQNKSWSVIDPKGVIGELAYEFGAMIRNPYPELLEHMEPDRLMAGRLLVFSNQFNIDFNRLKDWSFVQAVLAACWAAESNNEALISYMMKSAAILDQLKRP